VFTFFALAAVTNFSSDGSILHKTGPTGRLPRNTRRIFFIFGKTLDKGFISYVPRNERTERFKGHGTEVFSKDEEDASRIARKSPCRACFVKD